MWCGVRRAPLLAPVHNQHYSRQRGGVQLFGTSVTLSKTQNEKKVILKNKSRTLQIRKKRVLYCQERAGREAGNSLVPISRYRKLVKQEKSITKTELSKEY